MRYFAARRNDTAESPIRPDVNQQQAIVGAYSALAASYDEFDWTPVVTRARDYVRSCLLRRVGPGQRVLELNCGGGADAIAFARAGLHVAAFDAVPQMIEIARRRAVASGVADRVQFDVMRNEDVGRHDRRDYAAVFSNFGGLNTTEDLSDVFATAARLLAPGGWFVVCTLNRHAAWESFSYLVRGQARAALRRWGIQPKTVVLGGCEVRVRYDTPREFVHFLPECLKIREIAGLSICSPPLGSIKFASRLSGLTNVLCGIDDVIRRVPILRGLGDHFVVVAQRT